MHAAYIYATVIYSGTFGVLTNYIYIFRFDNPASVTPTPIRQLTYNYLLAVNAWLLLFPFNLCCDWTMGTIPAVDSLWDPRNLETCAFYIVMAKLVHLSMCASYKHAKVIIMVSHKHFNLYVICSFNF